MIFLFQFDCFGFESIHLIRRSLNGLEFLVFLFISFFIVRLLLWYGYKISTGKESVLNDFSEQPFYQSKDILLQEKTLNNTIEYIPVKTSTSIFTKAVLAILALTVLFTPLYELLNVEYFI